MTITLPNLQATTPLINRGIEREALRITPDRKLSQQSHPASLGSPLKNPYLTTDFAECLPEIITGVHDNVDSLLEELTYLHSWLLQSMPANEILWPASMPPQIDDTKQIPIAQYGTSHTAKLKQLYRIGLSNRYGSAMQAIAGIHYNISYSEPLLQSLTDQPLTAVIKSDLYMRMIRQFTEHQWLLLYLFSASPIIMRSSLPRTIPSYLQKINDTTYYHPYATSLRLSPLGYHNIECQAPIDLSSVKNYAVDLMTRTQKPSKLYHNIADIFDTNPQQLNKNVLQIENEFYNTVRPKPNPIHKTLPAIALYKHGVEYVEIRLFDLNPFAPLGITKSQILLTDILLAYCLLQNDSEKENHTNSLNDILLDGYNPALTLHEKAATLLATLKPVAQWLDQQYSSHEFSDALTEQINTLNNANQLPAQQLSQQRQNYQQNMYQLGLQHATYFRSLPIPTPIKNTYMAAATTSIEQQLALEKQDKTTSFIDFYQQTQTIPATTFINHLDKT